MKVKNSMCFSFDPFSAPQSKHFFPPLILTSVAVFLRHVLSFTNLVCGTISSSQMFSIHSVIFCVYVECSILSGYRNTDRSPRPSAVDKVVAQGSGTNCWDILILVLVESRGYLCTKLVLRPVFEHERETTVNLDGWGKFQEELHPELNSLSG